MPDSDRETIAKLRQLVYELEKISAEYRQEAKLAQQERDALELKLAGMKPQFKAQSDYASFTHWDENLKNVLEDAQRLERRGKSVKMLRRYVTEPDSMDPPATELKDVDQDSEHI